MAETRITGRDWAIATDEELLKGYFEGEASAFEVFFARHSGRVLGYLRKKGVGTEDAEELCQLVFLKLHTEIERYDVARPALPWFFTIVHNLFIDFTRRALLIRRILGMHATECRRRDEALAFQVACSKEEELEILEQSICRLPPSQQSLVRMRIYEEKSFRDIGLSLGKSEASVRKLYERTVRALCSHVRAGEGRP